MNRRDFAPSIESCEARRLLSLTMSIAEMETGQTVVISDNDSNDLNPSPGAILYSASGAASPFDDFSINSLAATSDRLSATSTTTSANLIQQGDVTRSTSTSGTRTLQVTVTDTGFLHPTVLASLGASSSATFTNPTASDSTSFQAFANTTASPVVTLTPNLSENPSSQNGNAALTPLTDAAPFSLSSTYKITLGPIQSGDNPVSVEYQDTGVSIVTGTNSPPCDLACGDTATIGFWHNKNGQALINSLNGGPQSHDLANWLASNFPNLYGTSSSNNLKGKTNSDVADLFLTFFNQTGAKTEAQVLGAALAVYVTDANLAGTTAEAYGFNVSDAGTGSKGFNVGTNGASVGLSNNTTYTIADLLLQANLQAGLNHFDRNAFNAIFDGINQAGDLCGCVGGGSPSGGGSGCDTGGSKHGGDSNCGSSGSNYGGGSKCDTGGWNQGGGSKCDTGGWNQGGSSNCNTGGWNQGGGSNCNTGGWNQGGGSKYNDNSSKHGSSNYGGGSTCNTGGWSYGGSKSGGNQRNSGHGSGGGCWF